MTELRVTLPWPPTVNTYWRHGTLGGKNTKARAAVFLSDKGKAFRTEAWVAINNQRVPKGALHGRLAVDAWAYPPTDAQRDLDNLWKGVLDALTHNGVIVDDSHIDDLRIRRGPVRPGGAFILTITELHVLGDHQPALQLTLPAAPNKDSMHNPPPF